MKQNELDEAIAKIRAEQPEDQPVNAAARRVFARLFDSTFLASTPSAKIRGCVDIQTLIPAYVARNLPAAKELLVEDHTMNCVECRKVLQEARTGGSRHQVTVMPTRRKGAPVFAWALAATLVVGIALGVTGAVKGLLPGQRTVQATVASVQGSLYRVTELGVSLVEVGEMIRSSDELRTAKGSRAILRLASGAQLEIAERSEVSVTSSWRGASVNLSRGQMIVDAGGSLRNALYVNSGDFTIAVKPSVFAVTRGTKNTRVAVAKGTVDIEQGESKQVVKAGNLYPVEYRPASFRISSEFDWSQNADTYHELLGQLSALQKDLEGIPSPGLRYGSELARYVPANTAVFAAIPNLGGTITEAKKLFDNRLASSEALRQWWGAQRVAQNGEFDRIISQIGTISSYLGDEVIVAMSVQPGEKEPQPVMIAQIKQAGLAEYLKANLPAGTGWQIVTAGVSPSGHSLLIDLDNNILVATPSADRLQAVEQMVQDPANALFLATPFYSRIQQVYQKGAAYFLAADLEQITGKSVSSAKGPAVPGLENVQYLVLERKGSGDAAEMRADLSFDGSRHGVASWLGAPGPAGSLDFVSPEAGFASTIIMKSPRAMVQELIGFASNGNSNFAKSLSDFETKAGINLVDDIAGPLGCDVTFALDGPLVPVPAWKLIIEVNDPVRLQQTISLFVDRFNAQAPADAGKLQLATQQADGRTLYTLSSSKSTLLGAYYTFVDGYLVASSSPGNVSAAIQNKQAGLRLVNSPKFRDRLPDDGYANFSAMVYNNLGATLGPVADQFKASGAMKVLAGSGPGLICVYGDDQRVSAGAKGSFLGFDLGTLVGIHQGQNLKTMVAAVPGGAGGVKGI